MPGTSTSTWPGNRVAPAQTTVTWSPSAASSRARRAARGSAAAMVASRAAANPTTPGTFSVPERSPCSCPPPHTSGRQARRCPHQQTADTLGPAQLVRRERDRLGPRPAQADRQGGRRLDRVGVERHPRSAAAAASRSTGCTTPVTLLAHITAARRSPGRSRRSNSAASTVPSPSTGAQATSKPRRSSSRAGSRTAGCSIALTTSRPGGLPARPKTAWLSASDPPEVNTT